MKIVSRLFPCSLEIDDTTVTTFVIENKGLYLDISKEFYRQSLGEPGDIVLSENDAILKISDQVEMIADFIGFEPNRKKLLSKVSHMLEEVSMQGEFYREGLDLLTQVENYMDKVAGIFPFTLDFSGISINSLIKMSSPKFIDEQGSELDRILFYMETTRELLGKRLFVMVGMKSFFSDADMQDFINTAVMHHYYVLLLESRDSAILEKERKTLLDNDICEI